MIRALRRQCAPTAETRKVEIEREYQSLCKGSLACRAGNYDPTPLR